MSALTKTPKTKVCTKCEKRKRMELFRPSNRGRFGFSSVCRSCDNKYHREYYLKNIERERRRQLASSIKYYQRNSEAIRKKRVEHYRKNAEETKENTRRYYREHTEYCKATAKERVVQLSDSYVANACLRVNLGDAPKDLIEAKRIQLQIKRYLKNGN